MVEMEIKIMFLCLRDARLFFSMQDKTYIQVLMHVGGLIRMQYASSYVGNGITCSGVTRSVFICVVNITRLTFNICSTKNSDIKIK